MTYWAGNSNYGMMMQCWALQQYLKGLGHDPYVIKFVKKDKQSLYRRVLLKLGLLDQVRRIKCLYTKTKFIDAKKNNKIRQFEAFRNKNLAFSQDCYSSVKELQTNPPLADCYITGSDQVWSQLLDDYENTAYYLNFGEKNTLRISYAPSFSLTEYPTFLTDKLAGMLKKLDHISVREYDGVEICKKVGFEAIKVLDPTLLLDKSHYLDLCKTIPTTTSNFIFIYSLNLSSPQDIRWEELREFGKTYNQEFLVTPSDGYFMGGEIFGDDVVYRYATIEEWLAMIRDAQLIVTPSFHGVALSIILEKPFVYIPLKGRFASGNNRVLDLLNELQLEDRILNDEDTYSSLIEKKIDWKATKRLMSTCQDDSISYMQNALVL